MVNTDWRPSRYHLILVLQCFPNNCNYICRFVHRHRCYPHATRTCLAAAVCRSKVVCNGVYRSSGMHRHRARFAASPPVPDPPGTSRSSRAKARGARLRHGSTESLAPRSAHMRVQLSAPSREVVAARRLASAACSPCYM